jgi:poly(3-hydroxybutyrate) depolymerase
MNLRALLLCGLLVISGVADALANSEVRTWTLIDGKRLSGELLSYDERTALVKLRVNERHTQLVALNSLSLTDQAWVIEWVELGEALDALLARQGGEFLHFVSRGAYPTGFHVYYPPGVKEGPPPPVLLLFDPSGQGERYVKRYIEAAAQAKMVVVGLDEFRNTPPPDGDELDAKFLERFKDLLPQLQATVGYDPARVFLGGTSGGAMRAFGYTAKIAGPWAGVFSNVGWLGPDEEDYGMPFPGGMRIAMVNGNKDHGGYVERDTKILVGRGNVVGFFSFEGGHQVPPPSSQLKAMRWLLGQER